MCDFARPGLEPAEHGGFCVDGFLHDDENPKVVGQGLWPCPRCNTLEFLYSERDEYQRTLDSFERGGSRGKYNPQRVWKNAKACALSENPHGAKEMIQEVEAAFEKYKKG